MKTKLKQKIQPFANWTLVLVTLIIFFVLTYSVIYWGIVGKGFINNPIEGYEAKIYLIYPHTEAPRALKIYDKEGIIERINVISAQRGVKYASYLIKLVNCESSFNQFAIHKVSSATGIFQILDMHKMSRVDRYDVDKSINWAIDRIEAGQQSTVWKDCNKQIVK
jgi:hypothetical protein